ncbi:MAG: DUF1343 domain-containing protein [Gemmatimonadota bacterium]|nr:DUF1343 domain-containing protein [Gemmatimonadota bacterium]
MACGPADGGAAGGGEASEAAADAVEEGSADPTVVLPGIDVLIRDSLHLVAGRRVGLITNRSGVARDGRSSIDVLHGHADVELAALFAPEHGIRGTAAEGQRLDDSVDEGTGIPIHSLYGETFAPTPAMLAGIDLLLFDLQDIGARYYTWVSTMAYAMRAAGENGVPFVVLDRPNPIGGAVNGPVLDPEFATFVGLYPVPVRHGMTVGELARLYSGEFGIDVDLTVVPVRGWTRDSWFDETGLPWIAPSLNMPTLESAAHYPGTCLFEGTGLSVGRGTPNAFQQIGAPWLDGDSLARRISSYELPGVSVEAVRFTPESPSDGKWGGEAVDGVRLTVTDRATYNPVRTGVALLLESRRLADDSWEWNEPHFDRLAGSDTLRLAIEAGRSLDEITAAWEADLQSFRELREPYILYR